MVMANPIYKQFPYGIIQKQCDTTKHLALHVHEVFKFESQFGAKLFWQFLHDFPLLPPDKC
jgi:hypothetical protein